MQNTGNQINTTDLQIYSHFNQFQVVKNNETYRSGMTTGAIRLQIYRIMQTQLDTTLIHMAVSDRPMYTSLSVVIKPSIGLDDMTFLYNEKERSH